MAMALRKPDMFKVSFFDEDKARRNFDNYTDHVIGYGRLSFDEDGEGYCSIINQRDILAEFYNRKFYSERSTYEFIDDDNVSGYKFERDGLFHVLRKIEEGTCNILIAKDLSRIGRHGALLQLFIEQCEHVGVRIVAMDDYDSQKESDELILGIRAWSNERVVKDTSAKILKIIRHKQKAGTWFCAAPFGYKVLNYAEASVEIEEIPAKIMYRIGEMYLDGCGVNKIARIFTEEGVITPSMYYRDQALAQGKEYKKKVTAKWSGAQISKMLDDPFYAGTLVTGRYKRQGINGKDVRTAVEEQHRFPNHHAAIWPQEMFDRIQAKRQGRRDESYRGIKKEESLFHGLLQCGECGQKLYTYCRPDLARQYICSSHFKYGKDVCTRHMIKDQTLVSIALAHFEQIKANSQEIIESLDQDVRNARKAEQTKVITVAGMKKELEGLEQELRAIEAQRVKQIMRQPDKEDMLNEIYDEMHHKTQVSIDRLRLEIESMSDETTEAAETLKKTKTALSIINEVLERGELTRRDVEALFERITVHEDGRVLIKMKTEIEVLKCVNMTVVDRAVKQPDRVYEVSAANVVSEGEPLEIFTENGGEVVLKKYSPIGEISAIAQDYCDSLYRTLGSVTAICDRDQVVACAGVNRRELAEKPLSTELERVLEDRRSVMLNAADGARMLPVCGDDNPGQYTAQLMVPVVADGEVIGGIVLLSRENGARMSDVERKVAETTAHIIGRQMEQ